MSAAGSQLTLCSMNRILSTIRRAFADIQYAQKRLIEHQTGVRQR